MDRKNYDRKTLMVMDTIGSYLVYTVYNSLYSAARKAVDSGKERTITDAYRKKLNFFSTGMSQSVVGYKDIIKSFLSYYQKKIDATVTMREFEDSILSQFIPTDYYKDFNSKQRDTTMRDIFIKATENFFAKILKSHVHQIIDDHKNKDNITILQEQILSILLSIRETYYDKFAGVINGGSSKKSSVGVPLDVVEKLRLELSEAKKTITELSTDRDRAINILSQTVNSLNSQKSLIVARDQRIAALEKQLLNMQGNYTKSPEALPDIAPIEPISNEVKKMSIKLEPKDDPEDNLFDSDAEETNSWLT